MSNMGYCRFQNTLPDLQDCYKHMDDGTLSDEETAARERIIKLAEQIVIDFGNEFFEETP